MSYVYDEDGTLIADTLTGGATTTWGQSARYIYLPTASGPMPVAAIYGTKHYAIQSDHLNTPRRLVQSDGQVAWQWAYSAFGDEKPTVAKTRFANADLNQSFGSTTVPAVTFNLRYPGQYFDQESSLHYNYHRSYSATTGRYTQADPIGLDGGWNRFGYVGGNPLSFTDPLGQNTITGGAVIGGSIAGPPGAIVGGLLGLGALVLIDKLCTPDDPCPPCKTVSGKIIKVGTIGFRPMDNPKKPQHGISGPHYNILKANQAPKGSPKPCQCFWQPIGAVMPVNLPSDAVPAEPFLN